MSTCMVLVPPGGMGDGGWANLLDKRDSGIRLGRCHGSRGGRDRIFPSFLFNPIIIWREQYCVCVSSVHVLRMVTRTLLK